MFALGFYDVDCRNILGNSIEEKYGYSHPECMSTHCVLTDGVCVFSDSCLGCVISIVIVPLRNDFFSNWYLINKRHGSRILKKKFTSINLFKILWVRT